MQRKGKPKLSTRHNTKPLDVAKIEIAQMRCPKGHPLPHKTNQGTCTPVFCPGHYIGTSTGRTFTDLATARKIGATGGNRAKTKREAIAVISAEADKIIDSMCPGDAPAMVAARAAAKAQKADELVKLGHAVGRWAAMRTYFKVPEGLEGADAEAFVQRRALSLSVDAVAELERQLKLGDDVQRREAARDILDMNGMRKREAAVGNGQVIMLISPDGTPNIKIPWMQRAPIGAVPSREQLQAPPQTVAEGAK